MKDVTPKPKKVAKAKQEPVPAADNLDQDMSDTMMGDLQGMLD